MRQLSKRTQYSLRALYALTRKFGEGPVLITTLAETETIPKKFLEQILVSLKSAGFVSSKKGKGGGYVLAQPPEKITIGSVIEPSKVPSPRSPAPAKRASKSAMNASTSRPAGPASSCARSATPWPLSSTKPR